MCLARATWFTPTWRCGGRPVTAPGLAGRFRAWLPGLPDDWSAAGPQRSLNESWWTALPNRSEASTQPRKGIRQRTNYRALSGASSRPRILLVEDNHDNAEAIAAL